MVPAKICLSRELAQEYRYNVKDALESLGLFVRITGVVNDYESDITASSQTIEAGTKVERGTVVEVHFVSSVIDYGYNT